MVGFRRAITSTLTAAFWTMSSAASPSSSKPRNATANISFRQRLTHRTTFASAPSPHLGPAPRPSWPDLRPLAVPKGYPCSPASTIIHRESRRYPTLPSVYSLHPGRRKRCACEWRGSWHGYPRALAMQGRCRTSTHVRYMASKTPPAITTKAGSRLGPQRKASQLFRVLYPVRSPHRPPRLLVHPQLEHIRPRVVPDHVEVELAARDVAISRSATSIPSASSSGPATISPNGPYIDGPALAEHVRPLLHLTQDLDVRRVVLLGHELVAPNPLVAAQNPMPSCRSSPMGNPAGPWRDCRNR